MNGSLDAEEMSRDRRSGRCRDVDQCGRWLPVLAIVLAVATCLVGVSAAADGSASHLRSWSLNSPAQSCDNAFDRTGLGGAGVGNLVSVGNGKYQLSIGLNGDVQDILAGGLIWPARATIWSIGHRVDTYAAGHPRPVNHTFHALIKLQGAKFGPRKRLVLKRGDTVIVRIHLTVTTPTTVVYVRGRIECTI
jgi:hypothetical protein